MKKKTLILAFLLGIVSLPLMANNDGPCIVFQMSDGTTMSYLLSDDPVITFDGDNLVLKTIKDDLTAPYKKIISFSYTGVSTGVAKVAVTGKTTSTFIYTAEGKLFMKLHKGEALNTEQLPQGLYVVKSGKNVHKIVKK